MTDVLNTLLAIFLLRGRPQDLPTSRPLVWFTVLAVVLTDYALDRVHEDPVSRLSFATAQAVLLGAVVWLALRLRGYPERWMQTIAPLYAASAFINLLSWPLLSGIDRAQADGPSWPLLFGFIMTLWFLAIMTQVLRHALAIPIALGLLAAISCLMTSGLALLLIFPEVMQP